MVTNQAEVFRNLLELLWSDFWVILLLGSFYFAVKHREWLKGMLNYGHKKRKQPEEHEQLAVRHSALTMGLGVVVVVCSYMITSLVFFLLPSNPELVTGAAADVRMVQVFQGAVVALIIAGYCLILSAGGRWLTYIAKLVATVTILALVTASIMTYL